MAQEYIIVNKTTIEKKIEELKVDWKDRNEYGDVQWCTLIAGKLVALEQILYQSTPLIPEIEKAYTYGENSRFSHVGEEVLKHNYISNFKLDI